VCCLSLSTLAHPSTRSSEWQQAEWRGGTLTHETHDCLTEEQAYTLASGITSTSGYRVLEVRRAWSAATAWQVEIEDRRTGRRLLLLSEDQFDARLMSAGEPTTVTTAARPCKEPAAAQVAPGLWPGHEPFQSEDSPSCCTKLSPSPRPPISP